MQVIFEDKSCFLWFHPMINIRYSIFTIFVVVSVLSSLRVTKVSAWRDDSWQEVDTAKSFFCLKVSCRVTGISAEARSHEKNTEANLSLLCDRLERNEHAILVRYLSAEIKDLPYIAYESGGTDITRQQVWNLLEIEFVTRNLGFVLALF